MEEKTIGSMFIELLKKIEPQVEKYLNEFLKEINPGRNLGDFDSMLVQDKISQMEKLFNLRKQLYLFNEIEKTPTMPKLETEVEERITELLKSFY